MNQIDFLGVNSSADLVGSRVGTAESSGAFLAQGFGNA